MFEQVKGTIVKKNGNENLIQVMGVGFFIKFLAPTSSKIPDIGSEAIIHLHHCLKDVNGTFNEFWVGFDKEEEKDFFLKLINIKGVGEKTAIAILSFYTPGEVISIVKNKDSKSLSKVPKIGGKTAEKFLLDMDKLLDPIFVSKFSGIQDTLNEKFTSDAIISETGLALKSLGITKYEKLLDKISQEKLYKDSTSLLRDYLKKSKGWF